MTKHKKYELKNLFDKYFSLDGEIIPIGNSREELIKIKDCITKGECERDCPDGYYKISDDEILIMEHFCFDSTTIKKGSESLAELARIQRENNKHDIIRCTISMKNYWDNLKENFTKHCSKVENYKMNLIKEGIALENTLFKIAFFIEDVTPLGNINIKTGKRIYSIFCDKFIDLFEKCLNVDYLFDFSEVDSIKKVLFVNKNNIEALRSNEIKIDKNELIPWKPQVNSFIITTSQNIAKN